MKYSNKKGGFAVGLIVLAIAALSVLGIVTVGKKMKPIEVKPAEVQVDNVVGSGGRVQTAATGVTSLTPWTENIDGGGYSITNILNASSTQLTTSGSTWLARTTGTVGIGVGADDSAVLDVHQVGNTIPMIQAQDTGANSSSSGGIFQATLDNGGAPVSGTRIGGYQFSADIGDAVKRVGAALNALATETWTTVANGTKLNFNVTANGSTSRTVALSIDQNTDATFTRGVSMVNATSTGSLTIPIGASVTTPIAGNIAIDTTSNQYRYSAVTGTTKVLGNGNIYAGFTYATSTAATGTTTIPLGVARVGEIWNDASCYTDTGTWQVSFTDGTNRMDFMNASTTADVNVLSTNTTFTAGEKRYVEIGTPVSSPTKVSCTISRSITAD